MTIVRKVSHTKERRKLLHFLSMAFIILELKMNTVFFLSVWGVNAPEMACLQDLTEL